MPSLWLHIQWSAFGAWLPGDPRGFRSHEHRVHSSGNREHPPPEGQHAGLLAYSKVVMHREPVTLDANLRRIALDAILNKLEARSIEARCLCVAATHVHLLARLAPELATQEVGGLKRASSHGLRAVLPGRVWAARCHAGLVRDGDHLRETQRYILEHERKGGAAVWRSPVRG